MKRALVIAAGGAVLLVLLALLALGPPKHPPDPKAECSRKARSALELYKCDPGKAQAGYDQVQQEKRLGELKSRIQALEEERARISR